MTLIPVIVIHGGAGTITRSSLTADKEAEYRQALTTIVKAGQAILSQGGSALDAVTKAVCMLEDNPLFNAGKGSVFTHSGGNELDAAIMNGATLGAGAVAGVSHVKNPILAARAVMENSRHVMFAAQGADAFAKSQGLDMVEADYYFTQARYDQLQQALQEESGPLLDHDGAAKVAEKASADPIDPKHKFGTVGAVAIDINGNLAAATSTGGMTNKQAGRIGDSPIIGAGCYANNNTVAVSSTGTGEMFIRAVAAYDVSALIEYVGLSLEQAAERVVMDKLSAIGGQGGLIAVDKHGNVAMTFNSEGMYRGVGYVGKDPQIYIYR